ncbi:zinc finger MYM-type protein 1-like, partial [Aphis craccivora]
LTKVFFCYIIIIGETQSQNNFEKYEKNFPLIYFEQTVEAYPFLDKYKLKTELQVIYKRNDFKNMSTAVNLLKFIIENQLLDTFSETSNLLKVIITIPMTTAEAERSFSTLKRIKTFLRSTQGHIYARTK